MTDLNKPLPGHCEGCDHQRLDIKGYFVRFHNVPEKPTDQVYEVYYCNECADLARADWSGTIHTIWPMDQDQAIQESLARESRFFRERENEPNFDYGD